MNAPHTRREFLADVGRGVLIASEYGRPAPGVAEARQLLRLARTAS